MRLITARYALAMYWIARRWYAVGDWFSRRGTRAAFPAERRSRKEARE